MTFLWGPSEVNELWPLLTAFELPQISGLVLQMIDHTCWERRGNSQCLSCSCKEAIQRLYAISVSPFRESLLLYLPQVGSWNYDKIPMGQHVCPWEVMWRLRMSFFLEAASRLGQQGLVLGCEQSLLCLIPGSGCGAPWNSWSLGKIKKILFLESWMPCGPLLNIAQPGVKSKSLWCTAVLKCPWYCSLQRYRARPAQRKQSSPILALFPQRGRRVRTVLGIGGGH